MHKETVIGILPADDKEKQRRKGIVRPIQDDDNASLLRRRVEGGGIITFYDLGQVNTGSAGSPVWNDHPILYNPPYTWYAGDVSHTSFPNLFVLERFGPSQYQDYLDMLFQFPVEDWSVMYRKVKWEGPGEVEGNDFFYREWMGDTHLMERPYVPLPRETFEPEPTYGALLDASVDDIADPDTLKAYRKNKGFAWTRKGLEFPAGFKLGMFGGFDRLWLDVFSNDYFTTVPEGEVYKWTSEYDPDAPDVFGGKSPKFNGDIDIYLLPEIMFWRADASQHTGWNGNRYTLGMHFQVTPRKNFMLFDDPEWDDASPFFVSHTDPDGRKETFLDYQRNRAGARCSVSSISSALFVHPITGSETSTSGSAFPINYYTMGESPPSALPAEDTANQHVFAATARFTGAPYAGGSDTSGTSPFGDLGIQLRCVMKLKDQYYYLWSTLAYGGTGLPSFFIYHNDVYDYSMFP